jgi:branched-chain amino acid transport system ATP-binding protein
MSVLRLDHLNKSFGSLVVTDDINLEIAPGERHVIIGPNGAGKTSLINQIGGQLEPSSGRIFVKDTDITGWAPSRVSRIGVARTFPRNNKLHKQSDRPGARRRAGAAAARRTDIGHVTGRDHADDRADRLTAAHIVDPDDRTRHEGGVLGRRPHHGALLWQGAGHRDAGGYPGQRAGARGLSRDDALMLELDNVNAYYGDSHILHGVSLSVREGEVVCLLGRNGAGKTTTILTVMGYLQPRPGFVPQERGIFPSLTVRENLTTFARNAGKSPWTLERIFELFPHLHRREKNLGFQLSGGEQQMLSIARALMLNPTLLLLDEPSEGLAPMIVQEIVNVMKRLKQEGLAILLVEQNLRAAFAVGDRHHVMNKGEICFTGTSAELEGNEPVLRNYLSV